MCDAERTTNSFVMAWLAARRTPKSQLAFRASLRNGGPCHVGATSEGVSVYCDGFPTMAPADFDDEPLAATEPVACGP